MKGIRCQRAKNQSPPGTRRASVAAVCALAVAALVVLAADAGAVGEGTYERTAEPLLHKPNAPVATPGAGTVPEARADPDAYPDAKQEAPATPDAPDSLDAPNAPDGAAAPQPGDPLPAPRANTSRALPECRVRESCHSADELTQSDTDPANEPRAQSRDAPRLAMPIDDASGAIGVGAGVGAVAATAYLLRATFTAGLVRMWAALAVRRAGGELEGHPVRSSIVRHLESHPGATTRELAQVAGVPYRRVVYHIAMLERAKRLRVRSVGRKRLHFPVGAPRVHDEDLVLRALVDPCTSSGRILVHIAAQPGPSLSGIARLFGLSAGNTHYHVQRLRAVGLVHVARQGACIRHYVTERGREWLQRVTPLADGSTAAPLPGMAPERSKGGVAA